MRLARGLALLAIFAMGAWAQEHNKAEPGKEKHDTKAHETTAAESHEAKGHESSEEGDKFIVWKWANFAILAAGLGYLMAKGLPAFFRGRTESIQKGIAEAQAIKRDAEQRAAATEAKVAALGAEIEKFRTEAKAEMQRESERIAADTARQAAKIREQAEIEIESATKVARRELKNYAAELAIELAEQRIKGRLDADTEAAVMQGFVNDLKRQGSQN